MRSLYTEDLSRISSKKSTNVLVFSSARSNSSRRRRKMKRKNAMPTRASWTWLSSGAIGRSSTKFQTWMKIFLHKTLKCECIFSRLFRWLLFRFENSIQRKALCRSVIMYAMAILKMNSNTDCWWREQSGLHDRGMRNGFEAQNRSRACNAKSWRCTQTNTHTHLLHAPMWGADSRCDAADVEFSNAYVWQLRLGMPQPAVKWKWTTYYDPVKALNVDILKSKQCCSFQHK